VKSKLLLNSTFREPEDKGLENPTLLFHLERLKKIEMLTGNAQAETDEKIRSTTRLAMIIISSPTEALSSSLLGSMLEC